MVLWNNVIIATEKIQGIQEGGAHKTKIHSHLVVIGVHIQQKMLQG